MRLRRAALHAFLLVLPLWWVASGRAAAGPAVDLHQLRWYVHVDLIDAGAGRDLAFWQAAIDDAAKGANRLLEGGQGPFDRACCTRITRAANVTTFGSPGDGRDVLDSAAEQNYFNTAGGAGSAAFLIDSISYCGGSAPAAVGCAERPACDSNGNDNPNLWMVATADAFDSDILAAVVAHERGHNACRQHVATAECQIMQASIFVPGRGGCLSAAECTSYRSARTTTASGQECTCITAAGATEADATTCAGAPLGLCSGGLCGNALGSAGVRLIAAAAPGSAAGGPPDDALEISALSGDWSVMAQFAPTSDDVRALAYAHDSSTLFGVVPTVTNDRIVTIDPSTGLITATVGIRANGALEIVSMAYDPGDTSGPGDDRLLVLEAGGPAGELWAIDPASPSTATLLGSITWSPASLFTGLAYDSLHDRLFAATPFGPDGLYEIHLAGCSPSPCESEQIAGAGLYRENASLAFSPVTGMLYLIGTAFDGQRTFYDVVDPSSGTSIETLSLDTFTPAGLAALPEPFGAISWLPGVLGVIVAYRARHGRNLRWRGWRSSPSVDRGEWRQR